MRLLLYISIPLSIFLLGTLPANAAFVIKNAPTTAISTPATNYSGSSVSIATATYSNADQSSAAPQSDRSKESKTEKKGYGLAAFLLSLLGLGAIAAAIVVLPASLLGFILLGVLGSLLGISAIGCSEVDKKSIFPKPALAHTGLVLGIIESLPILLPIFIIYLIYYLCGGGKHKNGFK